MTNRTLAVGGILAALLVAAVAWFGFFRTAQEPPGGGGAILAQAVSDGTGWDPQITEFDRVLGSPDAPVTMLEYASFTCGHCASFHLQTLPELQRRYVETGVLRYVFRDFPLDGLALRASLLARCVPEDQYFSMVNVLFSSQQQWATAPDPVQALGQIGRLAGLSEAEFQACMDDRALADRVYQLRQDGERRYQIDSTPTLIVAGAKLTGNQPIDAIAPAIERAAAAR